MSFPIEIKKLLYDAIQAIEFIEDYTMKMEYSEFIENALVQAAIERKFEVIGEALSRIHRKDESIVEKISKFRRIIGFRNILAHGYDVIDPRMVWDAMKNHLPLLKDELIRLFES